MPHGLPITHRAFIVLMALGGVFPQQAKTADTPTKPKSFTLFDVQLVCLPIETLFDGDAKVTDYGVKESEAAPKVWSNNANAILFSKGMLSFARSKDEIAFLCAREIANITAGRFRGFSLKAKLIEAAAWTLDGPEDELLEKFFHKRSRRLAIDADEKAILAMWQAGYDPMAATALWLRSPENKNEGPLPWINGSPKGTDRLTIMRKAMVEACEDGTMTTHCATILAHAAHQPFRTPVATATAPTVDPTPTP